jgi:hypothetical protein
VPGSPTTRNLMQTPSSIHVTILLATKDMYLILQPASKSSSNVSLSNVILQEIVKKMQ